MDELTQHADLPGGQHAAFTVGRSASGREYGVVRVEGRLCFAPGGWMDLDTARRLAAAVFEMAEE